MATVAIVYKTAGEAAAERAVLEPAGFELVFPPSTRVAEATRWDALMVTTQPVDEELLTRLSRCRIVCRVGTGLDAIDLEAANRRGVWVAYVPDYSVDEVSTHALTLILAQSRRLFPMVGEARAGRWSSGGLGEVRRLNGQVLGIVGFGRIGRALARKAAGVGLRVLVQDPYLRPDEAAYHGAENTSLETLLRKSDYVSLHLPLNDETRQLIDGRRLALMKPTAYLVNTARGALIDEAALVEAVRAGSLAGAALDVLLDEPPPPDHPLLHEPRILVTPHTGWYSLEAQEEVASRAASEVVRVLAGGQPACPANVPLLAREVDP